MDGEASAIVLNTYTSRGAQIVTLNGEYDLSNAAALEAALVRAVRSSPRVVLDLSGTRYIDSSALVVLIRRAKDWRGRLRLVLPEDGLVRRVFEITGLDKHFQVARSIELAVDK